MSSVTNDPLGSLTSLEGVPSGFAATRDGVDALLRDRGLRKTPPQLTTESLLRGACASAVLEGSGSLIDALRSGRGDETAQAAVRVATPPPTRWPLRPGAPAQEATIAHASA